MRPSIDKVRLAELWHKGVTVPQIAKIMNAKTDSLYRAAHRMGLPKRKGGYEAKLKDPEKRKWFIRNYPEMSNSTISVFLGLCPTHIGNLARKLGLKKSEAYFESIKEYHRRKVREFHATKKGDTEFYYRPRVNGRFVKKDKTEQN